MLTRVLWCVLFVGSMVGAIALPDEMLGMSLLLVFASGAAFTGMVMWEDEE